VLVDPQGSALPQPVPDGELSLGLTNATANRTRPCEPGSYCTRGVSRLCPAGVFGCSIRLSTPSCSGNCSAGFYCLAGSTSVTQFACGVGLGALAASVYCPAGSSGALSVDRGYYSTGSATADRASAQQRCEAGYYCINGTKVRPRHALCFVFRSATVVVTVDIV
jgi:hypothetical protein